MSDSQEDDDNKNIESPVVRRMLKNWKLSKEAESDNRQRALKALKFFRGGKEQWDTALYDFRIQDNRPTESYNQIPQFVHQVTNDMRMNMPQTRFRAGNDGSVEVAEIKEDLVRAIQAKSAAEVAYDTCGMHQTIMGWGYWRILTDYENDKTFDQIIKIGWVPNPLNIYDDPTCTEPDFRDRKFLIEVSDMDLDDFNDEYKNKDDDVALQDKDLESIGDHSPDWASDKTIRIAEYWELTFTKKKLYRKDNEVTEDEPEDDVAKEDYREVLTPKVMWYKCTATEKLEEREWEGKYIPYARANGEVIYIDGKVYYYGLVEAMMSAQKQYNYWMNGATEMVAMAPKAPFLVDPIQIQGNTDYWAKANVKNYAYLPYKRFVDGQDYGVPQRSQTGADIGAMSQLITMAQNNLYVTSGLSQSGLGYKSNEASGVAITNRQREGDISTYHFMDNTARALAFSGIVIDDLMGKIYDGARVIRLLGEDKEERLVQINQPVTDKNGNPEMDDQGKPKKFDLTTGEYDVVVDVGPSFTTKRQEAAENQIKMASAYPAMLEAAGDIIIRNQDWPGADEIADRLQAILPPPIQAMLNPDMKDIPPQVQAMIAQGQQLIQHLTQQLQGAQQQLQQQDQELKNKQMEYQVKSQDVQVKAQNVQADAQSDAQKNQVDMMNAQYKYQIDVETLAIQREELQLEALKLQVEKIQPALMALQQPAPIQQSSEQPVVDDGAREAQAQALMQALMGIQGSVNQLTAQISAPKSVVRDPQTGLVQGVVSATLN